MKPKHDEPTVAKETKARSATLKSSPSSSLLAHLQVSDLRAAARLATQATTGVTRIVEGVHQSVWGTLGAPGGKMPRQTRGITGLVYRSIYGVTGLVGGGLDTVLAKAEPLLELARQSKPGTPRREVFLGALNGVMGDHLVASGSSLATAMTFRTQREALSWQALPPMPQATGKVLLFMHGLCGSDLQWHGQHDGQEAGHVEPLAAALDATPLYLRYNSGLHTSQNGRELSAHLEQLISHWPTPVTELTVITHSLGGLVIRSAIHTATQDALLWPGRLKNIVFLGTPHHGSPLERAGSWLDTLLESTPYSAPFASLGQVRSAGITDLRYGHVLDEDWQGHDRFDRKHPRRPMLPLPEGVACFAIAATKASKRGLLADRLLGDGLVPLHSALGHHKDPARRLTFADDAQWIAHPMGHMELLRNPAVTQQMLRWLAPRGKA